MNITAANAAAQTATPNPSQAPASSGVDSLATESTFLKLLVAQIQNQDPTQPTDSIQYITQLAQFSSLEQLIGIHQGISTLDQSLQKPPAASTSTPVNSTQA